MAKRKISPGNKKSQIGVTLRSHVFLRVRAMADAERRSLANAAALLIERGLDAADAQPKAG